MFESRFRDYGRLTDYPNTLRMIYDRELEIAKDSTVPIELDVIGLCCEYCEVSKASYLRDYQLEPDHNLDQDEYVIYHDDEIVLYLVH